MKSTLAALCKYSGLLAAQERIRYWAGRSCLVVLVFHRVSDEIPEDGLTIRCARFRSLCRMLEQSFRVVTLAEIFRLVRAEAPLPPRTLAITFDDCYRDNLAAARLLADRGLPATFFLPTAYVGTDLVFPWDRGLPPLPNLTWEDVSEMRRLGFEIGSHTVTHADLGAVSAEHARREIVESKAVLEDRLGTRVRWFAYPFGGVHNFRAECLSLVQQAGYEGCVSAHGGFIYRGTTSAMLPRECVTSFPSNLLAEIYLTGCLNGYFALKRYLGLSQVYRAPCGQAGSTPVATEREQCHTTLLEEGLR
jgi:peptidoglycan/xylan/chitin deacetylase (PgdA/CDA1 family)